MLPAVTFTFLIATLKMNFKNVSVSPLNLIHLFYQKQAIRARHHGNSGILLSYIGGGVMGSMVTGFCVGLRIWRRKSFRCSLSDLILLTRRGRSKRLARLLLRVGKLGFGVRAAGSAGASAAGWTGSGVGSLRGVSSVELLGGSLPSFSTAARMSS